MLADRGLVFCQVDAEGFAIGHVRLDPLHLWRQLFQRLVLGLGRASDLFIVHVADAGDLPFDYELLHFHTLLQ